MWRAFWKSGRSQCSKTRDVLSGYVDRRLNPEEAARVEEHLSTCRGCREELESLRATVALLHRLPEVTPSRSFALAPAKPLPGRRVLPALRFATAAAVLLLVAAFAVDGTGVLEHRGPSDSYSYYVPAAVCEADADYWLVPGVRNDIDIADPDDVKETTVNLVVPDGTDNVEIAVKSLTSNGVVRADVVALPDGSPQLALTEGEGGTVAGVDAVKLAVVTVPDTDHSPFATNSNEAQAVLFDIIERQSGTYLNMVPAASDNSVLYSFDLGKAQKEVIAAKEADWLRPLEYGLIGLVAVLATATVALWLQRRRTRVTEVSGNKN